MNEVFAQGQRHLLTYAEASRILRISLRQFRRLVDGGKIPFVNVSERSPRVRSVDLENFLNGNLISRGRL